MTQHQTARYEVARRDPTPYAAITVRVSMQRLGDVVPPLNAEVFEWLAARGVQPAGPPFWKYDVIDMDRELTVEAGVAIAVAVPGDDRVTVAELPAGSYLQTTVRGHPDGLVHATADLLRHADEQGLAFDRADGPDGERWASRLELYLTDPATEPDLSRWETMLAFKLAD